MAFIPSRIKKHNTDPGKVRLNLTSMMDMFTIILVFLLKRLVERNGYLMSVICGLKHLLPLISLKKNPQERF